MSGQPVVCFHVIKAFNIAILTEWPGSYENINFDILSILTVFNGQCASCPVCKVELNVKFHPVVAEIKGISGTLTLHLISLR